jgi:DNA-binding transcriptional ArsR family regulator
MFKALDPLLHSELRLAVVSLLIGLKRASFQFLKEKTGASSGNLSVQIQKLQDGGYIKVEKTFQDNYPLTRCSITTKGVKAFEIYVDALQSYITKEK